ncbi:MAG: hypothetical protein QF600_07850 [Verrucomicrobiota bacterium]|nr:hypothetical protein [Verrucomicrobiota bacterium]
MIQPTTTAAIGIGQADKVDLARVVTNTTLSESEKLLVATKHFEALLARQILNDAYKPILGEGMGMKGVSSEIYRDMIVNQLGDAIGKSGAFGIASSMHGQLVAEQAAKPAGKEK